MHLHYLFGNHFQSLVALGRASVCWKQLHICLASIHTFMQLDAPSRGRALALAGMYIYAGNHRGMPCTLG
jgi:hypothetical protein